MIAPENLDYTKHLYISLTVPVGITAWWTSNGTIAYARDGSRGLVNNAPAEFSGGHLELSGSETIVLPKQFGFELSGNYMSRGYQTTYLRGAYGTLNVAFSKKFGDQGGRLVFGIDNLLNTQIFRTESTVPGQQIETKASYQFNYPLFKLAWSQPFGNKLLKKKRERQAASDEERRRAEN